MGLWVSLLRSLPWSEVLEGKGNVNFILSPFRILYLNLFMLSLRLLIVDYSAHQRNSSFSSWALKCAPNDRITTCKCEAQWHHCTALKWLCWEVVCLSVKQAGLPDLIQALTDDDIIIIITIIIISIYRFLSETLNRLMTTSFWEVVFEVIGYKMVICS